MSPQILASIEISNGATKRPFRGAGILNKSQLKLATYIKNNKNVTLQGTKRFSDKSGEYYLKNIQMQNRLRDPHPSKKMSLNKPQNLEICLNRKDKIKRKASKIVTLLPENSLTPIPKKDVKDSGIANKLGKKELKDAQRTAVFIRRLEYSTSMRRQIDEDKQSKIRIKKIELIQEWWKTIYKIIKIQKNLRGYFFRKKLMNNLEHQEKLLQFITEFDNIHNYHLYKRFMDNLKKKRDYEASKIMEKMEDFYEKIENLEKINNFKNFKKYFHIWRELAIKHKKEKFKILSQQIYDIFHKAIKGNKLHSLNTIRDKIKNKYDALMKKANEFFLKKIKNKFMKKLIRHHNLKKLMNKIKSKYDAKGEKFALNKLRQNKNISKGTDKLEKLIIKRIKRDAFNQIKNKAKKNKLNLLLFKYKNKIFDNLKKTLLENDLNELVNKIKLKNKFRRWKNINDNIKDSIKIVKKLKKNRLNQLKEEEKNGKKNLIISSGINNFDIISEKKDEKPMAKKDNQIFISSQNEINFMAEPPPKIILTKDNQNFALIAPDIIKINLGNNLQKSPLINNTIIRSQIHNIDTYIKNEIKNDDEKICMVNEGQNTDLDRDVQNVEGGVINNDKIDTQEEKEEQKKNEEKKINNDKDEKIINDKGDKKIDDKVEKIINDEENMNENESKKKEEIDNEENKEKEIKEEKPIDNNEGNINGKEFSEINLNLSNNNANDNIHEINKEDNNQDKNKEKEDQKNFSDITPSIKEDKNNVEDIESKENPQNETEEKNKRYTNIIKASEILAKIFLDGQQDNDKSEEPIEVGDKNRSNNSNNVMLEKYKRQLFNMMNKKMKMNKGLNIIKKLLKLNIGKFFLELIKKKKELENIFKSYIKDIVADSINELNNNEQIKYLINITGITLKKKLYKEFFEKLKDYSNNNGNIRQNESNDKQNDEQNEGKNIYKDTQKNEDNIQKFEEILKFLPKKFKKISFKTIKIIYFIDIIQKLINPNKNNLTKDYYKGKDNLNNDDNSKTPYDNKEDDFSTCANLLYKKKKFFGNLRKIKESSEGKNGKNILSSLIPKLDEKNNLNKLRIFFNKWKMNSDNKGYSKKRIAYRRKKKYGKKRRNTNRIYKLFIKCFYKWKNLSSTFIPRINVLQKMKYNISNNTAKKPENFEFSDETEVLIELIEIYKKVRELILKNYFDKWKKKKTLKTQHQKEEPKMLTNLDDQKRDSPNTSKENEINSFRPKKYYLSKNNICVKNNIKYKNQSDDTRGINDNLNNEQNGSYQNMNEKIDPKNNNPITNLDNVEDSKDKKNLVYISKNIPYKKKLGQKSQYNDSTFQDKLKINNINSFNGSSINNGIISRSLNNDEDKNDIELDNYSYASSNNNTLLNANGEILIQDKKIILQPINYVSQSFFIDKNDLKSFDKNNYQLNINNVNNLPININNDFSRLIEKNPKLLSQKNPRIQITNATCELNDLPIENLDIIAEEPHIPGNTYILDKNKILSRIKENCDRDLYAPKKRKNEKYYSVSIPINEKDNNLRKTINSIRTERKEPRPYETITFKTNITDSKSPIYKGNKNTLYKLRDMNLTQFYKSPKKINKEEENINGALIIRPGIKKGTNGSSINFRRSSIGILNKRKDNYIYNFEGSKGRINYSPSNHISNYNNDNEWLF